MQVVPVSTQVCTEVALQGEAPRPNQSNAAPVWKPKGGAKSKDACILKTVCLVRRGSLCLASVCLKVRVSCVVVVVACTTVSEVRNTPDGADKR